MGRTPKAKRYSARLHYEDGTSRSVTISNKMSMVLVDVKVRRDGGDRGSVSGYAYRGGDAGVTTVEAVQDALLKYPASATPWTRIEWDVLDVPNEPGTAA